MYSISSKNVVNLISCIRHGQRGIIVKHTENLISCIRHGQRGIIVKHTENIQQNDPKYSKSENKNDNFIEIIVFI